MDELKQLREENARLLQQLESLKAGIRMANATVVGTMLGFNGRGGTVVGLEEMILQIGADHSIGYLNGAMATLWGEQDRQKILGAPLRDWDKGPLGPGALQAVVDAALGAEGEAVVVERICPDLPVERLPGQKTARPAGDPVLRFVAKAVKGRVEIIAQDVTRLRWLESTFARYVAPEIIEQMLNRSEDDFMQMDRRLVSVLFVDLRGFTRITQRLEPLVLQEMINEFLSIMVACIELHGGTVDKFVGDEVMALFGAPLSVDDHALRAILTAVEMQKRHAELSARWEAQGRPGAGIGIGICTGEAFVGNIGTASRMDFTALGHTVNLAARLCARAESGEILTEPQTFQDAAEALKKAERRDMASLKFSPKGKQGLKNVDEPVQLLSVSAL